eukprot:3716702-Rhodomonas_salina.2
MCTSCSRTSVGGRGPDGTIRWVRAGHRTTRVSTSTWIRRAFEVPRQADVSGHKWWRATSFRLSEKLP